MAQVNITCRRCRHRHPADRSCEEAKRLADAAAAERLARRLELEALESCCDNEDRTMEGGCRSCGDPAW
jgi:hypothetical protein